MDKKLTPIWDELSAIGNDWPPGVSILLEKAYESFSTCIQSGRQKTFEINVLVPENRALRAENEALKLAHARYECVRRLSPRAFTELWNANLSGGGAFDDLVDRLIKNQPLGGLPK